MKINYTRALLAFVAIGLLAGCASSPETYFSNTSETEYIGGKPAVARTEQTESIQFCAPNPIKGDTRVVTNTTVVKPNGMTLPDMTQMQTLVADSGCDIEEDESGMPQHLGRIQQAIVATEKLGQQVISGFSDAASLYVNGMGAAKAIDGCGSGGCTGTTMTVVNSNSAEGNGSGQVDINNTPPPPAHGGCDIEGSCGD